MALTELVFVFQTSKKANFKPHFAVKYKSPFFFFRHSLSLWHCIASQQAIKLCFSKKK